MRPTLIVKKVHITYWILKATAKSTDFKVNKPADKDLFLQLYFLHLFH